MKGDEVKKIYPIAIQLMRDTFSTLIKIEKNFAIMQCVQKPVLKNLWSDVEKIIGGILPLFEDEIRVGR